MPANLEDSAVATGLEKVSFHCNPKVHVNHELPDVQAGFRKGRGTRDQIANIHWIMEKAREFQKNICFCFIDYAKAFDCVNHNKLWKILKEMEIPGHLTGKSQFSFQSQRKAMPKNVQTTAQHNCTRLTH